MKNFSSKSIRISFSLLLGCIFCINLTACFDTNSSATPTNMVIPKDWQTHWLTDSACRAPCWEGIIPGKTTAQQSLNILKTLPYISNATMFVPTNRNYGQINWDWKDGQRNYMQGDLRGSFVIFEKGSQKVTTVLSNLPGVRFGDVIKFYGEPTDVIATYALLGDGGYSTWVIYIVYMPQGLTLAKFSKEVSKIDANLMLEGPEFFVPGSVGLGELLTEKSYGQSISPWKGFKDFSFYCKERVSPFKDCSRVIPKLTP